MKFLFIRKFCRRRSYPICISYHLFHNQYHHVLSSPLTPTQLNHLLDTVSTFKIFKHATQIHTQLITSNYASLPFLFNNLFLLYAKCGHINHSLLLFSTTHHDCKNIVTWTTLITQLSHFKKPFQALSYFNQMRSTGIYPNQFTFSAVLPACADTMVVNHGEQMHGLIWKHGVETDTFVACALLDMYAKCSRMGMAEKVFDEMPDKRSIVSWNSMIVGFLKNNFYDRGFQALSYFNQMRSTGIYPNQFTFSAVLPACAYTMVVNHGEQMHGLIWKHGVETNTFVACALLDMYAKCSRMGMAEKVFDEMPDRRSIVSWTSMIVGFLKNNFYDRAVVFFREVLRETSLDLDQVTFSSVISACANMVKLDFGKQVHGNIVKRGLITFFYVKNSLLDMYSKCGLFDDARKLFSVTGNRDVVTWNKMIMGCVHNDNFEEACSYFHAMKREGLLPDEFSYSSALHASANLAALTQGTLIHAQILKTGFMKNACVMNPMITMYGKCGNLFDAYQVFEETENHDVVCWTAMIAVFQQHGCVNEVIELFEKMLKQGIEPDYITFVSVLSACSHTGHVEDGFKYFNSMANIYYINPGPACMVDLLAHVGRLDEAKNFIESMPIQPGSSVWGALLGACRKYGNVEMGREVAERLFELEPESSGSYVLLSNIYTRHGMLEKADEVRQLMGVKRVRKETGCCWIEVNNKTFVFTVNDKSHSKTDEIYEMLQKIERDGKEERICG